MKNRFWFTLSLVALFGGCADEAPEPVEVLQESAPEPPAIELPLVAPLAEYAEARGLPEKEPNGPDKQYRMVGNLVFHLNDQEVPQEGELLLGGSARMQFILKREGYYPNTFLLASPEASWVRFHNKEFEEYEPQDLWKESLIRWHVLRFPWGWQKTEFEEFTLETPLGEITLEVNENLLPSRASLRSSHVALSEWKAAENSDATYPMHWDWTDESGRRVESFTSLHSRALFVDSAFTPKGGRRDRSYLLAPDNETEMSGELLDFLRTGWQSVGVGEQMDSSSGALGHWYEHQGERRYVFEPGLEAQPGAKVIAERDWLVWSTFQKTSSEEALAYLTSALPQLKATADGDLWAHIPEQDRLERSVFVLPVLRD